MRIIVGCLTVAALLLGHGWFPHAVDAGKPAPQAATGSPPQVQPRELFDRQCLACSGGNRHLGFDIGGVSAQPRCKNR